MVFSFWSNSCNWGQKNCFFVRNEKLKKFAEKKTALFFFIFFHFYFRQKNSKQDFHYNLRQGYKIIVYAIRSTLVINQQMNFFDLKKNRKTVSPIV